MAQQAQIINAQSIGRYGYQLLAARNSFDASPDVKTAMRMLGVDSNNITDKNLKLAQNRLLDAMQEIMKEAGRPTELFRAADLGEAGTRLSGQVRIETLREIFTENNAKDSLFYFDQNGNEQIAAKSANSRFPEKANGMLALSKEEIAQQLMTAFDQKIGVETLHEVIEAAKSSNAWNIEKGLTYEADFSINQAVSNGRLVDHSIPNDLDPNALDAAHKNRMKKLGIIGTGLGLLAAASEAGASEGNLADKTKVFAENAVDVIPGVTYAKKMQAGQYEEARIDAASYLPSGLLTAVGLVREPEVQAVIDALPKDPQLLQKMQTDAKTPFIDRHLAELQLTVNEAIASGSAARYASVSSQLTELAEQKVGMQQQWHKNAELFRQAAENSNTNWSALAKKFPELAAPIAVHIAAAKENYLPAFLSQLDNHLAQNIEKGIPIQVDTQQQTHAQTEMLLGA